MLTKTWWWRWCRWRPWCVNILEPNSQCICSDTRTNGQSQTNRLGEGGRSRWNGAIGKSNDLLIVRFITFNSKFQVRPYMNECKHTHIRTKQLSQRARTHRAHSIFLGRWIYFVILIWRDDFTIDTWTDFFSLALYVFILPPSRPNKMSIYPPSSSTIWFCVCCCWWHHCRWNEL